MSHCTIQHKITSDTKCHCHKNDTINTIDTINTNIKYITLHTNNNSIKRIQQKIININNVQMCVVQTET
jgi:hypothetical protein